MTDDFDSVEKILKAAIDAADDDRPMLRRVLRKAQGKMARPASFDYASAMAMTDGAVCLELDFPDTRDRVLFRYCPERDEYERYGRFQSAGESVGVVGREAITSWIARYGVELVQHSDVRELFEETDRVRNTPSSGVYPGK